MLLLVLLIIVAVSVFAVNSDHRLAKRPPKCVKRAGSQPLRAAVPAPADPLPAPSPVKYVPKFFSKPNLSKPWTPEKFAEVLAMRDFTVLDVETTGLESWSCRIVQIGIIKVMGNRPVDFLSAYVNPEICIPASASAIHGITDADVAVAPTYSQIARRVIGLLNRSTVVGHNVTFDLNFVQRIFAEGGVTNDGIQIDYLDTWELAHRVHPHAPDYKLQTLLGLYGIEPGKSHTAYDDASATLALFNALRYEYAHKDELEAERKAKEAEARRQKREADKAAHAAAFSASPLYNVRFCFTGSFSISREAMEALAQSVGAQVQQKEVNGRTGYLVKGDVAGLPDWALARKLDKAEELAAAGKPVRIIDEADFIRLVADAKDALSSRRGQ